MERAVPSVLQRKARLGLSAGFIHPLGLRGWFHQGWDFFFFFFLRQGEGDGLGMCDHLMDILLIG